MALKQNTTLLAQLPLRQIGGSPGTFRAMWSRGDRMNQSVGEGISSKLASIPSGTRPPGPWVLAYQAGAIASFTGCKVVVAVDNLNVASGRNIDGSTTITVTVPDAQLQLTVSGSGSATISFTATGNLAGGAFVDGSATFSFTVSSATLGAIVDLVGQSNVSVTASALINAIGSLAGDITPFTTLSPENLAAAVLNAAAATPIASNVKQMNDATMYGTGVPVDLWRGSP